jgi:arylsulfatase A
MIFMLLLVAGPALARPNIILIVADDMGYGDLGSYGGPATPSLDALAASGKRFTDFHASPYCTPTRADIQTGRYHQRMGLNYALPWNSGNIGIPRAEVTIGEQLRAHGYNTALIGKWHLGRQDQFHPNINGYRFFFGMRGGQSDYFTHLNAGGQIDWWRNGTLLPMVEYSTTAFSREAIAFLGRTPKPFFLAVTYQAVHVPWQGPGDNDGRHHPDHYRQVLTAMDTSIGSILAHAPADTYVFFLSDNGGAPGSRNVPLRGNKGSVYEGGQRVAAIAKGPGIAPSVSTATLAAIDLYPTILALTGTPAPVVKLDGKNFSPVLFGTGGIPSRKLFWTQAPSSWAVRDRKWKLDVVGGTTALYDLSVDIGETRNVAGAHPTIVNNMKQAFNTWKASLGYVFP